MDRVRESIFNRLGNIEDLECLDLFAGCGSLGLEALSRGARSCVFVENNNSALVSLRKNIETLKASDIAKIIKKDAFNQIRYLSQAGQCFDLIFADPPYSDESLKKTLNDIYQSGILTHHGRVVFEHSARCELEDISPFELESTRKYGKAAVSFFIYPEGD